MPKWRLAPLRSCWMKNLTYLWAVSAFGRKRPVNGCSRPDIDAEGFFEASCSGLKLNFTYVRFVAAVATVSNSTQLRKLAFYLATAPCISEINGVVRRSRKSS